MNHQNKIIKANSLSLVRDSLKVLKTSSFVFIAAAFLMSGFFAPSSALAAATVTPASGGTSISIDTTSVGVTPAFTTLDGPGITENLAGDIAAGTHTITLPLGWEFDTTSNITISKFGGNIVLGSTSVTPTQTSFSFVVTSQSTLGSILGFGNLKVRPTGTIPSTGSMTYSGAGIVGVSGSTNFGTLSTVPGTVAKLAFTTQPGGAVYGSLLNPQPVVKTQDQFGNNSTNGLIATEMVSLTLTGTGVLQGTTPLNIGTGAATPGTVTFTDLKVSDVGAVGTKGLTASAGTFTNAVSGSFAISQKPITATVTVNNKPYDGNNLAVITGVTLNDVEPGDNVTVNNQGTATFASSNANTGIVVTSNGVTITGTHVGNYLFGGTAAGTANIVPLEITVTPTAGQTKVYGNVDPVAFAYTPDPALISPDVFTGTLSRVTGENVSTYAYTIGSLTAGTNYTLTLVPGTFEITQKPLTVTATGVNREYDQTTNATVTLSSGDEVLGDNLVYAYTSALFLDKTATNGKTVNVSGISISGPKAGNYALQNTGAQTTANITKKPITVTINVNNKTYDGTTNAVYSSTNPRVANGVIGGDTVVVEDTGTKAFVDKHVGVGKTVNATGLTLSGADAGNYDFDGTGTGTATISARPITVTAVTFSRIYNGTIGSGGTPVVTSTYSPPVALVDTANFIQTYDNKNVGTGKTLTPSGVVIDGNPTLEGSNYAVTFVFIETGVITKKSINVTAQPDTKIYDGTTNSIGIPVVGLLETGDSISTAPTQVFDTKDFGTGKTLIPSGLVVNDGNSGLNYNITNVNNTTGEIEKKNLTVSGATTNSKIYDGNLTATVNFTFPGLVGIVPGEEALVSLNSAGYSATFNNKNVATGKTVTVSGLVLAGAGASNYSLTQPVLNDGAITQRTLVVTATGGSKVYDGNIGATGIVTLSDDRVDGDNLTLTHTATFDGPNGKNVGPNKPISVTGISIIGGVDQGNYILGNDTTATEADITAKPITATITIANKVYDGNTSATITGRTLVGLEVGDDVTAIGGIATFASANAGTQGVSATGITLDGADKDNYSYNGDAAGTATINPLGITGSFTANNKVYDGNTDAEVLTQTLTGVLPGDVGNVTLTGGTAEFTNPNVADNIVVTEIVAMTLTGSAEGNYELLSVGTTIANITKAPLTITADNKSKEYGDVNPTLTANYVGFVAGENASVLDIPVVLSTTAVDASSVGTYPITASGATDNNYQITHLPGTLTVTQAPLTVTADAQTKVYGDADPTLTYTYSALAAGDTVSVFSGTLSRVAGENVGVRAITQGTLTAGGNYALTYAGANLTINKKPITVTAITNTKTYDGNTSAAGTPTFTGSLVGTDTANFTQTYTTADVGTGKTLTPAGIVNDGNLGNNYAYTFQVDTTGVITALGITITPTAGQTKVYGQADPVLFAYTFTPALIDGSFTGALGRATGDNVGTYAYTLGTLADGLGNYTLTLTPGTFAITKATPVITWANPANIVYGAVLSGTQLNATADVGGGFVYTPASGTVLNAGVGQTLSVAFTPTDTVNYNNANKDVLITVTPAPLTVTADNKSKEYGTANPPLTASYVGFVGSETASVLDTPVSLSTTANDASPAGAYPITASGAADVNYDISFAPGTLTITDTVAPTVVSHTPSFNALNISPTTAIVVTFSEPVDVEEVDVSFSPTISVFTITNSGTSVVTIKPNNPLADNTTYTITLTGVADINGNPLPTYGNIKFTTATNYSINLNVNASGWNLISLPVVPSNTAIATVLGSAVDNIDAVWTYDPTNPNAVNGWLVFVPGNTNTNNLTLMTTGFGYWVSVTGNTNLSGSGTLLIAGPTSPPSRSLQTGWNLIGYYQLPNEATSTPASAFVSIGAPGVGYNGLWGFDNTTGFFKEVTTILPGDGFWISLPSANTYTPSNL